MYVLLAEAFYAINKAYEWLVLEEWVVCTGETSPEELVLLKNARLLASL
jgi:hypothetical protein